MDHLECYRCGAGAAVDASEPFDFLMERHQWPQVPCEATAGCDGWLEPQALN